MVYAHLFDCWAGKSAVDDADVDAGFFEDVAVLEDAGDAAAAIGAVPGVDAEFFAVDGFEFLDDFFLLFFYEFLHSETHGGVFCDAILALGEVVSFSDCRGVELCRFFSDL